MNIIIYLIPISLLLGIFWVIAFYYSIKTDQYDDPKGNSLRILISDWDEAPTQLDYPDTSDDDISTETTHEG